MSAILINPVAPFAGSEFRATQLKYMAIFPARSRLWLAGGAVPYYTATMSASDIDRLPGDFLPADLAAELEARFFWWEPIGSVPRTAARILAQAMNFASFEEVRRLEKTLGPDRLAEMMRKAEPGWIDDRSWEFWRGRLTLATGKAIPDVPPRRSFDAG
jgi:hypothetical protein